MRVSVPASSANLGPGFDVIGMALDLPFLLSNEPDPDLLTAEPTHPAAVAFARAGGRGRLWWRSPIPPGRGLGFSGAARVAGAFLAFAELGKSDDDARSLALTIAGELEGHPDNAAASVLGGITVATGGHAVRVATPLDLKVVVWWPITETSTNKARAALPATVPFEDAVFNVGRSSLMVAALAAGDVEALSIAVDDRLHQDARLTLSPPSKAALDTLRGVGPAGGVVGAWLSGSGPTVAAFVRPLDVARVVPVLPRDGTTRVLDIDQYGARRL